MKYKLNDGRIMTEDELRDLWYANTNNPRKTDVEFDWWLYFKIECGAIKVVKGSVK